MILEKELRLLHLIPKATGSEQRQWSWLEHIWDLKTCLHSDKLPPRPYLLLKVMPPKSDAPYELLEANCTCIQTTTIVSMKRSYLNNQSRWKYKASCCQRLHSEAVTCVLRGSEELNFSAYSMLLQSYKCTLAKKLKITNVIHFGDYKDSFFSRQRQGLKYDMKITGSWKSKTNI